MLAIREHDLRRLQIAALAYALFGVLELFMVARFSGQVQWAEPAAWIYLAALLSIPPTGAYGWWAAREGSRRAETGETSADFA